MKRPLYIYILLLSLLPLARAAAQSSAAPLDTVAQLDPQTAYLHDYYFFEAERCKHRGDNAEAFDLYSFCLRLNPQSAASLYNLSLFNHYLRRDSLAIDNLERAVAIVPDNYWYQYQLVNLYYGTRRTDDAQRVLEGMAARWTDKVELTMMLTDLYTAKGDYDNVVRMLDKIELKEGKSEELTMQKVRIFSRMKKEDEAMAALQELIDEYPGNLQYKTLVGDLLFEQGKVDKAFAVYQEVLAEDSTEFSVIYSMAQCYRNMGDEERSQEYIDRLVMHKALDHQQRMQLVSSMVIRSLQEHGDSTKMLRLFDKIFELPQDNNDMLELSVRYRIGLNMPPDSVSPYLYRMLEIDPECEMARNQLLQYAIDTNDVATVAKLCRTAVEYGSRNLVYHYFLGVTCYQQGCYEDVTQIMRNAISKADDKASTSVVADIFALLGDSYHSIGDEAKAFAAYDSCLIYSPDEANVLNNYAYYLSLRKRDMERASEMSRRSNEISPDNPTYLDTYAWILYQQKRYEEAREYIDRTIALLEERDSDNSEATLYDHAGDIYLKLGNYERAVYFWTRAHDMGTADNHKQIAQKIRKYSRKVSK